VVMLTARSDETSRIAGLRALADDYITKPFREAELRQRVEGLITIRSILRQRFGGEVRGSSTNHEPLDLLGERDRRFVQRLRKAVEAHYKDSAFAVTDLARLVALSERQLQRKLKALTDLSPGEYLRDF